jgi:hypothetical protein
VKRWRYDFSFLNVSYRYVRSQYRGCELNTLYDWKTWELTWTSDDFTLYFISRFFKDKLSAQGPCNPGGVILLLKNVLGDDPLKTLREATGENSLD